MKAIANTYPPGEAAVAAIAAGCDARADVRNRQRPPTSSCRCEALEALIHAVERRALVDEAGRGGARAKPSGEGALSCANGGRLTAAQLRAVIGSEQHRAISEQMAAVRLIRMLKPQRLRPGDKIADRRARQLISPRRVRQGSRGDSAARVRAGLRGERVCAAWRLPLGRGQVRAQAFLNAWRDPSVRALIAVRGGYGSVHLLPFLEKEDLRQTPKAFIGYSDLTTVLTYLTGRCGIVSFHGPMLDRRLGRGIDAYDRDSFVRRADERRAARRARRAAARDVPQGRGGRSA